MGFLQDALEEPWDVSVLKFVDHRWDVQLPVEPFHPVDELCFQLYVAGLGVAEAVLVTKCEVMQQPSGIRAEMFW